MARRDNTDPDNTGVLSELGMGLAAQPAHHLQSGLGRHRGQALGSEPQADRSGTAANGPATTCPTSRRTPKPDEVGPFIMNAGGHRRACSRAGSCATDLSRPTTSRSNRRSPIRDHPKIRGNPAARVFKYDWMQFGTVGRVPLCGDVLSADRAFPLLDQARPRQCGAAAGILRRDFRGARRAKRASSAATGCGSGRNAAR